MGGFNLLRLAEPGHEPFEPFWKLNAWLIVEKTACLGNIRPGDGHITWLGRKEVDLRGFTECYLQVFNQFEQFYGLGIPEINHIEIGLVFHRPEDSSHNIIDESVIAAGAAVAKKRNDLPSLDERGELVDRQIRAL